MNKQIRFHLDENADPDIARALRRYGIDITTTVEADLRMSDDSAQWAYAQRERRVIVTHDDDFLVLASKMPSHHGVAYCKPQKRSLGELIETLRLMYEVLSADEMKDHIEYL